MDDHNSSSDTEIDLSSILRDIEDGLYVGSVSDHVAIRLPELVSKDVIRFEKNMSKSLNSFLIHQTYSQESEDKQNLTRKWIDSVAQSCRCSDTSGVTWHDCLVLLLCTTAFYVGIGLVLGALHLVGELNSTPSPSGPPYLKPCLSFSQVGEAMVPGALNSIVSEEAFDITFEGLDFVAGFPQKDVFGEIHLFKDTSGIGEWVESASLQGSVTDLKPFKETIIYRFGREVGISDDGQLIAVSMIVSTGEEDSLRRGRISLYEQMNNTNEIFHVDGEQSIDMDHLALSKVGNRLAISSLNSYRNATVDIYDIENEERRARDTRNVTHSGTLHTYRIKRIHISDRGNRVVLVTTSNRIQIFEKNEEWTRMEPSFKVSDLVRVDISGDGNQLMILRTIDRVVVVYSFDTGSRRWHFNSTFAYTGVAISASMSRDGQRIAIGTSRGLAYQKFPLSLQIYDYLSGWWYLTGTIEMDDETDKVYLLSGNKERLLAASRNPLQNTDRIQVYAVNSTACKSNIL